MKTTITFTIFFICFVADSQTWARLVVGGKASGNAHFTEPLTATILGIPIAFDGNANAAGQGQAVIGRGLNLEGHAAGSANLEPIHLVILGTPISLQGGGTAQGHGKVNIGGRRQLAIHGNAGGTAELDEPILLNILGLPIGFTGKGAANAAGSVLIGPGSKHFH